METSGSHATRQEALYRMLYLRREYSQLSARSRSEVVAAVTQEQQEQQPRRRSHATSSGDASALDAGDQLDLDSTRDVILLPPPVAATPRQAPTPTQLQDECWRGLVHVRHRPSPWYGAVFTFLVYFPRRYPAEAPCLLLEHDLRSHPLLSRQPPGSGGSSPVAAAAGPPLVPGGLAGYGVPVPFLAEACQGLNASRASVMAAVLRHVKLFFYPAAWPAWWTGGGGGPAPAAHTTPGGGGSGVSSPKLTIPPPLPSSKAAHATVRVSRMMARRDVRRHSLHSRDAVLGRPYVDLLAGPASRELLNLFMRDLEACESRHQRHGQQQRARAGARQQRRLADGDDDDAVVMRWSEWYGRELLPQMLALP